jgi:UDP-N-acetylglucosamine diphosphorylase/glucosamine-1-phosphate N-acetyltransferase
MTDLRPSFDLRTGAHRTLERIERRLGRFPTAWWVPDAIAALWSQATEHPVNTLPAGDTLLLINGRWLGLGELPDLALGQVALDGAGAVIAAHVTRQSAQDILCGKDPDDGLDTATLDLPMLVHPWDLMHRLGECLVDDLDASSTQVGCPDHVDVLGAAPVRVHPEAIVTPGVVIDATAGAVVVARSAVVRPGAVLIGPCHIGRKATVLEQAVIRSGSVIGPGCRVGGEVGASVLQGWSNKAHEGYLGDSWVGEWVNLGAGTTTSNLLNTYGEVSMRVTPEGIRQRTSRTHLGAIIGDHVKTAIGTRLMTGTVLGTGCMIACSSPPKTCLGPLRWCTDDGERSYRIDKFVHTASLVMGRRGQSLSEALKARLHVLAGE